MVFYLGLLSFYVLLLVNIQMKDRRCIYEFEVVKCTVDAFEKDYEYERFVSEIGGNMVLPPHLSKYIYDISFECSLEVKRKATEEQSKKPLTLKDTI